MSAVHESEAAPAPTDAAASDETATGGAAGPVQAELHPQAPTGRGARDGASAPAPGTV